MFKSSKSPDDEGAVTGESPQSPVTSLTSDVTALVTDDKLHTSESGQVIDKTLCCIAFNKHSSENYIKGAFFSEITKNMAVSGANFQ